MYVYTSIRVHMYVCTYIHICIYIYIYVCMYTYVTCSFHGPLGCHAGRLCRCSVAPSGERERERVSKRAGAQERQARERE